MVTISPGLAQFPAKFTARFSRNLIWDPGAKPRFPGEGAKSDHLSDRADRVKVCAFFCGVKKICFCWISMINNDKSGWNGGVKKFISINFDGGISFFGKGVYICGQWCSELSRCLSCNGFELIEILDQLGHLSAKKANSSMTTTLRLFSKDKKIVVFFLVSTSIHPKHPNPLGKTVRGE